MKIIFQLLLTIIAISTFGQKKDLTIDNAVMNYDSETKEWHYPSGLSRLQWLPETTN